MNITPQLLVQLKAAGGLLVPEPALRVQLRIALSPAPTGTEISDALNQCESKGWILSMRDEMSTELKWRITDSGRAVLAERGL
jgi:hypothetical protein